MQDKAALGVDRTALEHLHAAGAPRKLDQLSRGDNLELHQEVGKADVRRRLIDDNAHGALGGMRANIDHTASKPVIAHGRHRDQHLAVQIAAFARLARLRLGLCRFFGRHRLGTRRLRFGVGGRLPLVLRAGLAMQPHLEMLPDWALIETEPTRKAVHASCHDSSRSVVRSVSFSCMFFMYVPPAGSDHTRVHDEFSGTRKVSAVDRATMTGLKRLRRSAALVGICTMSLIAASDASADDASPWDGDARSAVRLVAG